MTRETVPVEGLRMFVSDIPSGPSGVPTLRRRAIQSETSRDREIAQDQLDRASMYWVGSDMCELLFEAAGTVPDETTIDPAVFPASSALVAFERNAEGTDANSGGRIVVSALHWYPVLRSLPATAEHPAGDPWPEVDIDSYTYLGGPIGRLVSIGGSVWPLKVPLSRTGQGGTNADSSVIEDRRLLAAFLYLLRSPGICDSSDHVPSRQVRRAAERAGRSVDAVRIINLRRPDHPSSGNREESNYHHRWIVSGHWRSQPHGPGRSLRRPVWIAPHVKGPDGAPLLTGEKVRVLR